MTIPIFRPQERSLEVDLIRTNSIQGGVSTGFERLDEYFSIKRGYPITIAGEPYHGKTQFVKQLLVNLSRLHGFNHAVYLGEDGCVEEIILEIAEIYLKKPLRVKDKKGNIREGVADAFEREEAMQFVDKHFRIVSPDDADITSFDIETFYKWVEDYEREYNYKFDTTVIDPWNDLELNINSKQGREDLLIADGLKLVRQSSKQNNRTDIIITHIAARFAKHRSERGIRYATPAEANEYAGGQSWKRRSFQMLLVYRPPSPDTLKIGRVKIETNKGETWLIIQKSKPKGVGQLGRCSLYYNTKTQNYQEQTLDEE
tara:strand:- start:2706 stop:3650 length:945 start_codon:yes stop_codon:yes gene_type:complete